MSDKLELLQNLTDKEIEIIARCVHFCSVTEGLMNIIEPEEAEAIRELEARFAKLGLY